MDTEERDLLKQRAAEVETAASRAKTTIAFGTLFCLLFVTCGRLFITRSLSGRIGEAVRHVESSSSELQSAANQQASGAKESSTAMNEITTTISELLATSRQIAESAQRVAHVAEETSAAARAGDQTVQKTHESVGDIKRQVDIIVTHMLDLGKKSQQIGGILEIINELAEQTNILAINATIESAGAGDAGKRFGVVADEIRKLADRVGGSTKEIRALIEEIRAAVNTTVMATEGGTKAVDLGARQFVEVTSALSQITALLATTTEAAQRNRAQHETAIYRRRAGERRDLKRRQGHQGNRSKLEPDASDCDATQRAVARADPAHPTDCECIENGEGPVQIFPNRSARAPRGA